MSHESRTVVAVKLGKSWGLAVLLVCVHVLAASTLVALEIGTEWKQVFCAAICASACHGTCRDALRLTRRAIVGLVLDTGGGCRLSLRNGDEVTCTVLGTSFVSARMVVLNLGRPMPLPAMHVVLMTDAVDSASLRRLRVWLLWGDGAVRR